MRVGEFLAFMARLRGVPERSLAGAVERVLEQLALGAVVDKPTRALSRGYRQRTALAQAVQFTIRTSSFSTSRPAALIRARSSK